MRYHFTVLLTVLVYFSNAQTDSLEKAILYSKILSNEISQEDFSKIGQRWNQTIKKIKQYPDQPLNQKDQVVYSFLNTFKYFTKDELYNRILEWFSISYGLLPLYSNFDDGKIIMSNAITINKNYSSYYKIVITIKSEKILIEFVNIEYQSFFEGHYSGDSWIPDKTNTFAIEKVFPVILKDESVWELNLFLLKMVKDHFNNNVLNLTDYIVNYNSNYQF